MIVFFFNDTATTEIYTLSLHDALPICILKDHLDQACDARLAGELTYSIKEAYRFLGELIDSTPVLKNNPEMRKTFGHLRSEEHTSELQSRQYLVCRLLLEKKKNTHDLS